MGSKFGVRRAAAALVGVAALLAPALSPALSLAATPPTVPDPVLAEATGLSGIATFVSSGAPGMVLVVVKNGRSLVLGYGETAKGNGNAPNGKSLFRLNSTSKVFTTEVLADLAAEGRLALTDPLGKFTPDLTPPTFAGRPITLLDLATHSAGLPREMSDEPPPGAGPRDWPTRADRRAWLPRYRLKWAPGGIAAYSNIGFDLLADALETAGGQPYPALLRDRVTAPLGMADTGVAPSPEQCARLMTGSGLGGAVVCGDQTATAGSGGLYSTGDDLAIWMEHNLAEGTSPLTLSHALYRPRQTMPAAIGFDEAGPMTGLGLGWVIIAADGPRPTLIEKSGGGAGFMSYLVMAPGRGVGVFVVANRVDFAMFRILTEGANGLVQDLATR